jgi:predicted ATPase
MQYTDVFLMEEPELGIHPHQLNSLMCFIKETAQQKQFIITTHSPEVLDSISANELDRIQIMHYDEARETAIITRIPAEKQAIIQKYMQEEGFLSDFWKYSDLEGGRL